MSECITKIERIKSITEHPNADKLELAQCRGWHCVIPKNVYSVGDLCVYIPIDSVLPEALEETLFSRSKVKLTKGRIKTIKLRGAISQGLIANIETIHEYLGNRGIHIKLEEGLDITKELGIEKYEPPAPSFQYSNKSQKTSKKQVNPNFGKYTDLQNYKNYPEVFKDNDIVVATEKIHGTNFRAGWVPFHANTTWKRIKKILRLSPKYEFVYGSHNVQLQGREEKYKTFYEDNVYWQAVKQYDLKKKLRPGEVIYGEIYGDNIQKNYSYGLDHKRCVFFDLKIVTENENRWANYEDLSELCFYQDLPMAPKLFMGKFKDLNVDELFKGSSELSKDQKIREGFVLGSLVEEHTYMGRKKLKFINPEYLLQKGNSDYH